MVGEGVEDEGEFDGCDAAGCGEEEVGFGVVGVVGCGEGRGGNEREGWLRGAVGG